MTAILTPPEEEPENKNDNNTMNNDTNPPVGEQQKSDGTELTVPSVEGCQSVETESLSNENTSKISEEVTPKGADIFDDLAVLGRSLDEVVPSEKLLTSLPVRKPKKDEWVRCHPEIFACVNIYENKDARECYLVLPDVIEPLSDVVRHVRLSLAVNYAGIPFLWILPVPSDRQNHHSYISAFVAADRSTKEWIRIAWQEGDYAVHRRRSAGSDPVWPREITDASDMLRFASKFGAFEIIDNADHPVVKHHLGLD